MPPEITTPFGNGPSSLTAPSQVTAPETPVVPDMGRKPASAPTPDFSPVAPHEQTLLDKVDNGSQGATASVPQQGPSLGGFQGGASLDLQRDMSIAMSTDDKAKVLEQKYGKGNVHVQDDEIYFRNPGQSAFQKASASIGDMVNSILNGQFSQAAQAGQSMIASHQEGLASLGGGTAAMMVGGAVGGMVGGPIGAAAGAAVGAGAEDYFSQKSRQYAIDEILDRKSNDKQIEENAQHSAVLTGILSASGDLAMGAMNKLAKGAQQAIEDYPLNKARSMVLLSQEISDAAENMGARGLYDTGQAIQGAIELRKKRIGQLYIGKYDQLVEDAAEQVQAKVPLDNVLTRMKGVLQKENVQFQGAVPISAPGVKVPRSMSVDPAFETGHSTLDELLATIDPEKADRILQNTGIRVGDQVQGFFQVGPYFGSETGKETLQTLLNDYQRLLAAQQTDGGLKVSEFRKWEMLYGNRGNYDADKKLVGGAFSGPEQSVARQIDEAFSQDKIPFYSKMLGDSSQGASYLMDSYRYQTEKDAIKLLQGAIGKGDVGPEIIVNKAISTNDPQVIRDLKGLFGSDNPDLLGKLRGATLQKAMQDGTRDGMVDLPSVSKNFKNYNPQVMGELFSPAELRKTTALMDRANRMISTDFKPDAPGVADTLGSMAGIIWGMGRLDVPSMARNFYSIFGKNQEAYQYLTNTLLPRQLEMAKAGRDFVAANNAAALIETLTDYRTLSQPIKLGSRTILVPMPALKQTFVQAGKSAIQSDGVKRNTELNTIGR